LNANTGGVVYVLNHVPVNDTTPPERIKDMLVDSVNTTNNRTIFNLSWTAPGNDLNVGRGEVMTKDYRSIIAPSIYYI